MGGLDKPLYIPLIGQCCKATSESPTQTDRAECIFASKMTDPPTPSQAARGQPRQPPGTGLRRALLITLASGVVLAIAIVELRHSDASTTLAELAAIVALLAFGGTVYGLLQTILVLVESAGERRRQAREVSERRHGDRAQKRN